MKRRVLVILAIAAGAALWLRRRRGAASPRVQLGDGGAIVLTLGPEEPDAVALRAVAGDVLRTWSPAAALSSDRK